MKLGIGLPNGLTPAVSRGLLLDWAREADSAGFHCFGTLDHPGYDTWDPIVALTAAAAVTERVRLATTILQLPGRNELQVAQQMATLDRLSGGRVDMGVAVGSRTQDYIALGSKMKDDRGRKMERQIRKMRKAWRTARRGTDDQPSMDGPAPIQKPGIPIWIGGSSEVSRTRATKLGDGYIYGATVKADSETKDQIAALREAAAAEKKKKFAIVGIRYVALGEAEDVDRAAVLTERYYGEMKVPPEQLFLTGDPEEVLAAAKAYEETGLDLLILIPQVPNVRQVTMLGESVLPSFRVPGA